MNTRRKIITTIIGAEVVIIAAVVIFLFYINSDTVKVNRQLELAQRYLLEEDYEQAIAMFEIVIDIDPKNVDAYLGLSEAYVFADELGNAVRTLEKAAKQTDSEEILGALARYSGEMEQQELVAQRAAEAQKMADAAVAVEVMDPAATVEIDQNDVIRGSSGNDDIGEEQSKNKQNLYMSFINNNMAAVVRADYSPYPSYSQFSLERARSYTFTELSVLVNQVFFSSETGYDYAQYAYVDCPDSDSTNFLVRFYVYDYTGPCFIFFVLTEDCGQLYLTDTFIFEGRGESKVYCNGLGYRSGSYSAATSIECTFAIMSNGKITDIYEEVSSYGNDMYYYIDTIKTIYGEVFGVPDPWDFFSPPLHVSMYTIGNKKYYTYELFANTDGESVLCETYINRCRNEVGINWMTEKEVLEVIKKRCSSIGVDYNSMEYQEEVHWVTL